MRVASTVTGSEDMVRRIDATEEGGTTLAGGSKKERVLAVSNTTAAYL